MAEFEVNIVKIDDVIDHPNADKLTIVKIGGYNCIANKKEDGSWRHSVGDLIAYIPEQAVIPKWLLVKMGFWDNEKDKGMLAGTKGNRVKAMKLRGIFSQGLLLTIEDFTTHVYVSNNVDTEKFIIGDDVAEFLGVEKYEPPIPTQLAGQVWNAYGLTLKYDIENIQRYPNIFNDDEEVVVTEKLHGCWCCYGFYPNEDTSGVKIVTSKGLSANGLALKLNDENANNLFIRVLEQTYDNEGYNLLERFINYMGREKPIYLLGEVYGQGVQDLNYGESKPKFRLFDIYVGKPKQGKYLDSDEKIKICNDLNIELVPELYRGPFNMEKMVELRDGRDYSNSNIREGIVILPINERSSDTLTRVQLKYVSPDYLLRKNGTEYQ